MSTRGASGLIVAFACALGVAAPAYATFPGANGKIYFTASAVDPVTMLPAAIPDVWSVNPDGTGLVNLTDLPGGPGEGSQPAVNADGTKVAFKTGSQATSEIWTMNADGSNPVRLTNDNLLDQQPSFYPDGSRIAFARSSDSPTYLVRDIWSMRADGSDQQVLVNTGYQEYSPEFTADGTTMVMYHETGGTNFDIAKVPGSGGPFNMVTQVTTTAPAAERHPSLSPDGSRVAFQRAPTGAFGGADVITSDLSGGNEQVIAADPAALEGTPYFSPDGTKIAYSSNAGTGQIVIAGADGSSPNPLPVDPNVALFAADPAWAVAPPSVDPPPARDTTAPETTITKKPKKKITTTKVKFGFISSEAGSTFECKLDRKAFKPCTSPQKYKKLKPKRHSFQVRATDAAGNVDATPAKARFKVKKKR